MTRNVRLPTLVRSVVGVVREQQLSFLAAAIAYYAFVSLIPLVLFALAVATLVGGQAFATQVVSFLREFLTAEATAVLQEALTSGAGRGGATLFGLGVLLWSSLRLFRGLDIAFSRVYGSHEAVPLPAQLTNAAVVLSAIAVGLGVTALVGAALPLAEAPFLAVLGPLFLVVGLSVVFFPLYYVFPEGPVTVREAVPGAVFAAVGWAVLGTAFGIYADRAVAFQLYGVIGGVLLALTWLYLGGLVVLMGAALNAALGAREDRQLQQGRPRDTTRPMSTPQGTPADEGADDEGGDGDGDGVATVEPEAVDYEDLAELRRELERFEAEIEERTVHRDELEAELKQYVRRRARRGHARGWGPYLVLLYGTAMTLGAFYLLDGGWAILAMLVVWLSTLGLYALMVIVGVTTAALGVPGRAIDVVRNFRS